MSRCDNCIYQNPCEQGKYVGLCHKFHIMPQKNCDDFEHWNKVSGDGV